jgi:hypothetical protein
MTTPDDTTPDTQVDPQSHLDHDPANRPDTADDPAHDTGEDEGWESEGGSNPEGPATDS